MRHYPTLQCTAHCVVIIFKQTRQYGNVLKNGHCALLPTSVDWTGHFPTLLCHWELKYDIVLSNTFHCNNATGCSGWVFCASYLKWLAHYSVQCIHTASVVTVQFTGIQYIGCSCNISKSVFYDSALPVCTIWNSASATVATLATVHPFIGNI